MNYKYFEIRDPYMFGVPRASGSDLLCYHVEDKWFLTVLCLVGMLIYVKAV